MAHALTVRPYLCFSVNVRCQSSTIQLHMILASSWLMRMSSAAVRGWTWASRLLQYRLTRSSILSMAPISSSNFACGGDKISLKRLRARSWSERASGEYGGDRAVCTKSEKTPGSKVCSDRNSAGQGKRTHVATLARSRPNSSDRHTSPDVCLADSRVSGHQIKTFAEQCVA